MLENEERRTHTKDEQKAWKAERKELERALEALQQPLKEAGIPVMLVFEGWSAAGKGAVIARTIARLDPRNYQVLTFGTATDEEKRRPLLWPFWKGLPAKGQIAVLERSWFGRALERMEEEPEETALKSYDSDKKQTVWVLDLSSSDNKEKLLSLTTPKEVENEASRELSLVSTAELGREDSGYYAYACGRLEGIFDTASDAIQAVYDRMGVVADSSGRCVWTRANRAAERHVELKAPATAASREESLGACISMMLSQEGLSYDVAGGLQSGMNAYEILNEAFSGRAVDLQGCILNQILYYVDQGRPVLAVTEGDKAELIVGYDVYTNLVIYDPLEGSTYLRSEEDAESYYAAYGYPFVSWM